MSFSLCVVVKLTQNKHISGKWAVKKRVQKSPNLCNVQKFNAFVLGNDYELGLTIWLSHVSLDISLRTCATLANSGSHTSWKGEVYGYGGVWLFIFDIIKVYGSNLGKDGGTKSDEFPKGGGGAISIQKFMLQILETLRRAFWAWKRKKLVQKKKSCLSHISGRGLIRPAACHVWSEPSDFLISSWSL